MSNTTKYVSDSFLAERYSVHRVTIWRWVREGKFPSPIKLTAGCSRWRMSDVERHEADRMGAA